MGARIVTADYAPLSTIALCPQARVRQAKAGRTSSVTRLNCAR